MLLGQLTDVSVDEWDTDVLYNSLWNFESTDNVVVDEISYSGSGGSSEGYCLDPLGVIFHGSQYPYVSFGGRVYRAN